MEALGIWQSWTATGPEKLETCENVEGETNVKSTKLKTAEHKRIHCLTQNVEKDNNK